MKIEKITENKIRVILKHEHFNTKSLNSENILLEILDVAKSKYNFNTDGYKLLIESFLEENDIYILTITKFNEKKAIKTFKKSAILDNTTSLNYKFESFDDFCDFCKFIKMSNLKLDLYKKSILYFYNNTYYLVFTDISMSDKNIKILHSFLIDFSTVFNHSETFKNKLNEHGKIIFKSNALSSGIKYFGK